MHLNLVAYIYDMRASYVGTQFYNAQGKNMNSKNVRLSFYSIQVLKVTN